MSNKLKQMGRLALRHEGTMWNAYWALPGTMEGALPLGSIVIAAVVNNPERKCIFQQMMTDIVADIMEERFGVRPIMDVQQAPEHERGGHS